MTRRILTITSGKGGVGKTNLSVNLALRLSGMGHRVCLFDADLGLANVNILLGLQPAHDLRDVIKDGLDLQDVLIADWEGIDILPGSSGVEEMANLEVAQTEQLIQSLSSLDGYEFLLFDTSAGISKNVVSFCISSPEVILVITPEPTSLTDGYSLLKVLSLNGFDGRVMVVVNQCKNPASAKSTYAKFKGAVEKYLSLELFPLGMVYHDPKVIDAVKHQRPIVSLYPEAPASVCMKKMAERLVAETSEDFRPPDLPTFWKRWFKFFKTPLKLQAKEEPKHSPSGQETGPVADSAGMEVSAPGMEPALVSMMQKLIDSVASLSTELRLIREAMGGNNGRQRDLSVPGAGGDFKPAPKRIRLDMEGFLRRRSRAEEKEG